MIPPFGSDGNLPPGVHDASWGEVAARFGGTPRRVELLVGLRRALVALRKAGCRIVYLDGSLVTVKGEPADFDACWDPAGVDYLRFDPVLYDFANGRRAQKAAYGGELFPTPFVAAPNGVTILDYFQLDRTTERAKGIVMMRLEELD